MNDPRLALEHETAVIGSMLAAPEFVERVCGAVDPDDFADKSLARLFIALVTLHAAGKPINNLRLLRSVLVTMRGCAELADYDFIRKISESVATGAHGVYHAELVRRAADKRRVAAVADLATRISLDGDSDAESDHGALRRALQTLERSSSSRSSQSLYEVGRGMLADMVRNAAEKATKKPGIMTGLSSFDASQGPVLGGDLMIIAARPGCGKTAFAMQFAMRASGRGKRVLFVSLEMRDRELLGRLIGPMAKVEAGVIRSMVPDVDELARLSDAVESLATEPIRILDDRRLTVSGIRHALRLEQQTRGLDAVFVDYLQLVKVDKENRHLPRHEQVAGIVGELKAIAGEFDVPVVCLAQLNREADGQRPALANLRESGAIEQDADSVLFIHHTGEAKPGQASLVELVLAKNRHGQKGVCSVYWIPAETRFTENPEAEYVL